MNVCVVEQMAGWHTADHVSSAGLTLQGHSCSPIAPQLLHSWTEKCHCLADERLGFKESWLGYCVIVLVAWCLVLIVGTGYALKKLNFQNK